METIDERDSKILLAESRRAALLTSELSQVHHVLDQAGIPRTEPGSDGGETTLTLLGRMRCMQDLIPKPTTIDICPECGAETSGLCGIDNGKSFILGAWCPTCEKMFRTKDEGILCQSGATAAERLACMRDVCEHCRSGVPYNEAAQCHGTMIQRPCAAEGIRERVRADVKPS